MSQLSAIANFDFRKLYDKNGDLKKVSELDDETAMVVNSLKVIEDRMGQSETKEFKVVDKKGAIDTIIKVTGWAAPEKIAQTTADGSDIVYLPKKDLHD